MGTLDALADVVGCALLIRTIAPEQILASPLHVGNGFVKCAHGVLPVPAPATAELLRGIPFYTGSVTGELLTPTGAAILHYYVLRYLPMPTMTASEIGYGIGSKDFGIANCVRAFLGDTASYLAAEEEPYSCDDTILSISCNIDDMTGEALGLATEIFMAAGALDVFTIPIQMKKNRPGILLTCLCEMEERENLQGSSSSILRPEACATRCSNAQSWNLLLRRARPRTAISASKKFRLRHPEGESGI